MTNVKQIRIRTLAIPLMLMMVHALVISTISDAYEQLYPLISSFMVSLGWPSGPAYETPLNLIMTEYPRIAVLSSLVLIPIYSLILFFRHLHHPDDVRLRRISPGEFWSTLAIAGGLLGLTNLIFAALSLLAEKYPQIQAALTDYLETASAFTPAIGYGWLTLGVAVLAPISEELLFRGLIQGELRRAFPEWLAVVIQGVLFALFHAQPVQIAYVLIPGLVLGALYALTRSLWVPIVLHIAFNFLGSVVPAAIGTNEGLLQIVSLTEIAFIAVGILAWISLSLKNREA